MNHLTLSVIEVKNNRSGKDELDTRTTKTFEERYDNIIGGIDHIFGHRDWTKFYFNPEVQSTTSPELQIQKGLVKAQVDYIQPPAFS